MAGILAGVTLAWFVTAPLAAFLVAGVSPSGGASFTGATALLMLASLAAIWGPLRRAIGIAPSCVLKGD